MSFADLAIRLKTDPLLQAAYQYKAACTRTLLDLPGWDPDKISFQINGRVSFPSDLEAIEPDGKKAPSRYIALMRLFSEESYEEYLHRILTMVEDYVPHIKGLSDHDQLRMAYWWNETHLQLVIGGFHALFDAYCKEKQSEDAQAITRRHQRHPRKKRK
jgi:hypothetical protein